MNLACIAIFPTSKSKNLWGNYELSLSLFFFLTNPRWLGYLENARIRYIFQNFPYLKTKHKQIPEKHVLHTWENLAKRIFRQKDAISFSFLHCQSQQLQVKYFSLSKSLWHFSLLSSILCFLLSTTSDFNWRNFLCVQGLKWLHYVKLDNLG